MAGATIKQDFTRPCFLLTRNQTGKCRFTASGGADEGDSLTRFYGQAEIVDERGFKLTVNMVSLLWPWPILRHC